MNEAKWSAVDNYIVDSLIDRDAVLDEVLSSSAAAGLPEIQVTPNFGKFLHLLSQVHHARNILEIGTLGGYSTIWLARSVPAGGRVVTIECEPKHAEIAKANFQRAGLSEVIDVRIGKALDVLPRIAAEKREPFDLIFIDADKQNNPEYFAWALKLSRPGSVIIVDNVVRKGEVINAATSDSAVHGTRRLYEVVAAEPRVNATTIQTVGNKGYDGFLLAIVNG